MIGSYIWRYLTSNSIDRTERPTKFPTLTNIEFVIYICQNEFLKRKLFSFKPMENY